MSLQRMYTLNVVAALLACTILLGWLILLWLSIIQADSRFNSIFVLLAVAVFLPINVLIKHRDVNSKIKLPDFLPRGLLKVLPTFAFVVFLLAMVVGILAYPAAPIHPTGNTYIDKLGAEYSVGQYRVFQKWEATLAVSWTITALQAIVFWPFWDEHTRRWKF